MEETLRSIVSGIVAAVVFLLLFLGLKWNFIICVLLGGGIYGSVFLLSKPKRRIGEVLIENMENGEELERKLKEAKEDFQSIQNSMEKIEDENFKEQIRKLAQTSLSILNYLEKHPEKIMPARRFIDYYQDRASSLLLKYIELQETKLDTKEINSLKENIKNAMGTLNIAFDKQFQKIMSNELLDVDAEIKLIEQAMKTEGLS